MMDAISIKSVSSDDDHIMELEEANEKVYFDEQQDDDDDVLEIMEEAEGGLKAESSEENDDVVEEVEDDPLGAEVGDNNYSANVLHERHLKGTSDLLITKTHNSAPFSNNNNNNDSQVLAKNTKAELVIVDTKSILSGRGPIPVQNATATSKAGNPEGGNFTSKSMANFKIPDDAFLIEAPSFIVPYVFEQKGETSLKNMLKELQDTIKKEKEQKGELYQAPPEKKNDSEDYFESTVGKLLISVGMNLVQEYVQADLLKMQKKKAEKERHKSRGGFVPLQTQQSIISLKNNLEESKENNEPFRHKMKKCEFCNFKTESDLVMASHLETPHMKNYNYRCNFCAYGTRFPHEILFHMESNHKVRPRLERAPAYHQCPNCPYEDNSKAKLSRHVQGCTKRFRIEKNLEPPQDWDTPAKLRLSKNRLPQGLMNLNQAYLYATQQQQRPTYPNPAVNKYLGGQKIGLPPLVQAPRSKPLPGLIRTNPKMMGIGPPSMVSNNFNKGLLLRGGNIIVQGQEQHQILNAHSGSNQMQHGNVVQARNQKGTSQPSISITPLPRQSISPQHQNLNSKPQGKTSFVICEICDGYIKDLDQLRNHMQWIHKVKIHPKMIYNKPPLNCQKCQFRFFTDQGLERHLLGSHGLVTSSMQDAANKGQDNGRCPLCGKIYQWKLLAHVAKDHNVTLKPAHLSYKCTVCTATFGMYKLFESHVYSAHSVNSKRNDSRKQPVPNVANRGSGNQNQVLPRPTPAQNTFKPLKINDEITIIPQPSSHLSAGRSRGALTITPHSSRRVRGSEDEGIQIIEIDDSPQRNGRKENGELRLPISDSILRKRNLEISLCGTDSDNNLSDESSQITSIKRIKQN